VTEYEVEQLDSREVTDLLDRAPLSRSVVPSSKCVRTCPDKKARAFLLAPDHTEHPLIRQLVDDRVLHIIKRGYSSKDEPGTRYDVLQIDYGCYVSCFARTARRRGSLVPMALRRHGSGRALRGR
jgi:hypothetical protein